MHTEWHWKLLKPPALNTEGSAPVPAALLWLCVHTLDALRPAAPSLWTCFSSVLWVYCLRQLKIKVCSYHLSSWLFSFLCMCTCVLCAYLRPYVSVCMVCVHLPECGPCVEVSHLPQSFFHFTRGRVPLQTQSSLTNKDPLSLPSEPRVTRNQPPLAVPHSHGSHDLRCMLVFWFLVLN